MINNTLTPADVQWDTLRLGKRCESCGHTEFELSAKETETYHYLIQGFNSKAIGEKLFLSPKTINTYKYRIAQKLGLSARTGQHNVSVQILLHFIAERAIVLKELFAAGGEDISPEFLAGYISACKDIHNPDIRMVTTSLGIISEREDLSELPRSPRGYKG